MSFFKKNGFNIALAILAFIFLFKIGEAFLGRMSVIFYKEMGFTKSDIALYSKGLGMDNYCNFYSYLEVYLQFAQVLSKQCLYLAYLMASTNLLFSLLAWSGKSELLFAIAVIFDDMAAAFATVAFVAFISMLVDRTYTRYSIRFTCFNWNCRKNNFSRIFWSFGRLVKWRLGYFLYHYCSNGNSFSNISLHDKR